jgi:SAM-dependent methyltransferase
MDVRRTGGSGEPSGLHLLPRDELIKTGPVDEADWNFRPILGAIQRKRFQLVLKLLDNCRFHRLLEVGYGSGVFLTELMRHCSELYGIDPHPMPEQVETVLARHGVTARLYSGDAAAMPFTDAFFDCVVAVSSLEFIPDLARACREIARVLTPDGIFVVVTPGCSALVDFGLKVLTGSRAADDFGDRRQRVLSTLSRHFIVQERLSFPPFGGGLARLYTALRLSKPPGSGDPPALPPLL